MTLAALAQASRLSKGFISQVENGHSSPSLSSLQRIADALEQPMTEIISVAPASPGISLVGAARPRVVRGSQLQINTSSLQIVGKGPLGMLLMATICRNCALRLVQPSGSTTEASEAFCHVVKGTLAFQQQGQELDLYAGDVLTWDPTREYRFESRLGPSKLILSLPGGCELPEIEELAVSPRALSVAEGVGVGAASFAGPLRLVEMRAHRAASRRR
jgi:mannose-6-phosphate isomerase-like protein (cupin superfamily)